jgi:hypothetical protein
MEREVGSVHSSFRARIGASGTYSSVSGGSYNTASGNYASVSGGNSRSAPSTYNWSAGSLSEAN